MQTRKEIRLPHFDYARHGMYFVTICLRDRVPLLGRVEEHDVRLTSLGEIVAHEIARLGSRFREVGVDLSIVMPDHTHVILALRDRVRTLGAVVGALKSSSAAQINTFRETPGTPLWQRGYYDHVIRDDEDLDRIRVYIKTNPTRWSLRHTT